tara:strand:+ start:676 stop:1422 length:747 start_codon:yes stop_codon:yes gene_type:complete
MSKTNDIVVVNEIKYLIKNKNDLIQKVLLQNKQWNNYVTLLICQFIKKFNLKHFLNLGCHIGTVALPVSKYINKVTAIEAFPPTYHHLLENIKINNIKNIENLNIALGDKKEKIYFLDCNNPRIKNNTGGMHVITENDIANDRLSSNIHNKNYFNTMQKLDDLEIPSFDIMLVDIEGKEYEMFKGGKKKILENSPIIIVEIWNNKKRDLEKLSSSNEDVVNYILKLGYKLLKQIGDNYIFFPNNLKIN